MFEFILTIVALLIIAMFPVLRTIPWACLAGFHKWEYAGQRSYMEFRKDRRGVTGGHRPFHKCSRCDKIKK